jgi:hypothetical protein
MRGQAILMAAGLVLLALVTLQAWLHVRAEQGLGVEEQFPRFVAIWAVEGAVFLCAVRLASRATSRGALAIVVAFGVALRLVPLATPAFLSSDAYRYVWDGRVQNAGINPYCCIPSAPELVPLREPAIYPHINRSDYAPTIYPPAAQMLFAVVAWASETVFAMKLAMAVCEAISCACLSILLGRAGLPRTQVLIYAWNPLAVWEYAGSGHVDAAATAWLALALVAATSARPWLRWAGAGFALAGATLTKFLPIVTTPAFWRRDPRLPAAFGVAILAAYACYASVGWRVFGFLGGYTQEEGLSGGGGVYWLRLLGHAVTLPSWAGRVWLGLTALVLAGLALAVTLRAPRANSPADLAAHALILATALIVMLTPHYAWYFGWLAFLACLAPFPAVLWLTVACVVLYMDPVHDRIGWESVLYLPFLVLAIRDGRRAFRRS